MDNIQSIIEKYRLEPHPEGGFYREIYRSDQNVLSPVSREIRKAVTHIYFLLTKGNVSRFHKVLHDEIWNFYEGDPLRLIEFDGSEMTEKIIGAEGMYVEIIKGGFFQAAETTGEYTLVGCSVAPGFDFKDFSFIHSDEEIINKVKDEFPLYSKFV